MSELDERENDALISVFSRMSILMGMTRMGPGVTASEAAAALRGAGKEAEADELARLSAATQVHDVPDQETRIRILEGTYKVH